MTNTRAFTLIELLVVVLIIGILAAVALPKYEQAVLKSRIMQVLPYLKSVKNAEEVYYMANGSYTNDINNLTVDGKAPSGWTIYLMESDRKTVKAKYQDGEDLHILVGFDHRTDYPEWNGLTYCYAKEENTKYYKLCKSMGNTIPNAHISSGFRFLIGQ